MHRKRKSAVLHSVNVTNPITLSIIHLPPAASPGCLNRCRDKTVIVWQTVMPERCSLAEKVTGKRTQKVTEKATEKVLP